MKSALLRYCTSFFLICLLYVPAYSQDIPLFQSDDILKISIETDMKALLKLDKEDKYQKAIMRVADEELKIRLRPRGNNRFETCSFPPITLNFKNTEFSDTTYNVLKKLKLVNTCKLQIQYEQYLLREYMIYKTFNLLSDYSFKVRLLQLEYIDTKDKMKPITRYGFVIEDQHILARRLNGVIIKNKGLSDLVTAREQMVLLSVFQYMIGNTDWQVSALHNLKLLKLMDYNEPAPYVIPYDFDYTGMVNASYAIPSDKLDIDQITDRLYWGQCYSKEEFAQAITVFQNKKEEIYEQYQAFDLLNKQSLSHSLNYLNGFYKIIENERRWPGIFKAECR
jgi:hypothetical protein